MPMVPLIPPHLLGPQSEIKTVSLHDRALVESFSSGCPFPSDEDLDALAPGDYVKVGVGETGSREAFWLDVESIEPEFGVGRVVNDLKYGDSHGVALDDRLTFRRDQVLVIAFAE